MSKKLYSYKIAGRSPGSTDHSKNEGTVEAESPKMAIIRALAKEYGDEETRESDPIESLGEWSGDGTQLREDFDTIEDDEFSFCLDSGENTFDVEVSEGFFSPLGVPKKWTIMTVDDKGRCVWGKGAGKPKIVEAASLEELNKEYADEEVKPFKVKDGVWLLQCPPQIILAIEEKR